MGITRTNSMCLFLKIQTWSGFSFDREASDEVNVMYDSDPDAGRWNKRLIPKSMLAEITKIGAKARKLHDETGAPWLDRGGRVIRSAKYFEILPDFQLLKSEFEIAAKTFQKEYSNFLPFRAKTFMGKRYNKNDYPEASKILKHFVFEIRARPIPEVSDWRLTDSEDERKLLEDNLTNQLEEQETIIRKEIAARVFTKVNNIYKRVTKELKFRKESFENLPEISTIINDMNVFDDPRIMTIADDLLKLSNVDVNGIRKDKAYRAQVGNQADAILKKLQKVKTNANTQSDPESKKHHNAPISLVRPDVIHAEIST